MQRIIRLSFFLSFSLSQSYLLSLTHSHSLLSNAFDPISLSMVLKLVPSEAVGIEPRTSNVYCINHWVLNNMEKQEVWVIVKCVFQVKNLLF